MDNEMLLTFFKTMMDKGLLQEMLNCLNKPNAPYSFESDKGGLKVVRGNTVKMDVFDTGNPNAKAYYQELVSKEESKMSAGFLTIENSRFDWELTYEEIDYVIEGTLTVEINGKTYTAYPGDVLFVPSGSKVVWGSPDKARVFYTTYPANWADLL
jgi:ethanolamine utilization protein EutQ